jgi:phage/plasmid-associated DNA primase
VREFGDVREWKESRTAARPGSKVEPSDAYAAYKEWCTEAGKEPVSLTAFGTIMKGDLGVLYEEKNKRGFYLDLALVGAPKLVASGHALGARVSA